MLAAVAWPSTLLGLASVIDNPWHVCTKRAENAGKHLAEVLVTRQQVTNTLPAQRKKGVIRILIAIHFVIILENLFLLSIIEIY